MQRLSRQARDEGIRYLEKNDAQLFMGSMFGYEFLAAALRFSGTDEAGPHYRMVYTIKSKRDQFNYRYALGILGMRMCNTKAGRYFQLKIQSPGNVKPEYLSTIMWGGIESHALNGDSRVPPGLRYRIVKGNIPEGYITPVTLPQIKFVEEYVMPSYAKKEHAIIRRALYAVTYLPTKAHLSVVKGVCH